MDITFLTQIARSFGDPNTIDNRDILCYQRKFYEGIYDALEALDMLGHQQAIQLRQCVLQLNKINARIKHLDMAAYLLRKLGSS